MSHFVAGSYFFKNHSTIQVLVAVFITDYT